MKLEGSYEVKAPRQKVWDAFLDPETLRKAIPGCEKLELMGPDEYKATLKIGVAAVKGTFEGKVRLLDKKPPESYRLSAEGSGARVSLPGRWQPAQCLAKSACASCARDREAAKQRMKKRIAARIA